jgi:uncharacterized protein YggE
MSRRTWIVAGAVIVTLVVIVFAATALAQGDTSAGGKPVHTIRVSSTATVKASPDEAVIGLGVHSEAASSADAFAQNGKDMQAVLDALKAAGIDEKDIETTNVSLQQRVTGRGTANEQQVFVASNAIRVTIHDLSSVGSVIDAAVGAGADSVNDIRFQLANPDVIRTDALTQAVTGARAKADALAHAADATVVRVVTIDEQNYQPPMYDAAIPSAALAGGVATPVVPPNSLDVTETVSVVWEIA